MANALLILILLISALAAILAGMAVFGNNRPPDSRMNTVLEDLDEVKGVLSQLQKSFLQIERKIEKEGKDTRAELKDQLEQLREMIDKRLQELA